MMILPKRLFIPLIFLMGLASPAAQAGPYGDDMAKCLVQSTTNTDRGSLVRWIFAAVSAHPEVKSLVNVSSRQRDKLNKSTAKLFERLLTVSCREQTRKALKYEGQATIQSSFRVLGAVAGRELFADPSVANSVAGLANYIDKAKLDKLFDSAKH